METEKPIVLLLDDTDGDHIGRADSLEIGHMRIRRVSSIDQAVRRLSTGSFDAMLAHERAAGRRLIELCRHARLIDPGLVIVSSLVRRQDWLERELFNCGADDVVCDGFHRSAIATRIRVRMCDRYKMGLARRNGNQPGAALVVEKEAG